MGSLYEVQNDIAIPIPRSWDVLLTNISSGAVRIFAQEGNQCSKAMRIGKDELGMPFAVRWIGSLFRASSAARAATFATLMFTSGLFPFQAYLVRNISREAMNRLKLLGIICCAARLLPLLLSPVWLPSVVLSNCWVLEVKLTHLIWQPPALRRHPPAVSRHRASISSPQYDPPASPVVLHTGGNMLTRIHYDICFILLLALALVLLSPHCPL